MSSSIHMLCRPGSSACDVASEQSRTSITTCNTRHEDRPRMNSVGDGIWLNVLQLENRAALEQGLPAFLQTRRWFGGKARSITSAHIRTMVPVTYSTGTARIAFVQVSYDVGDDETYVLPLAFASGERAIQILADFPQAVVTQLMAANTGAIIYDALTDPAFCGALLELIARPGDRSGDSGTPDGGSGELLASTTEA